MGRPARDLHEAQLGRCRHRSEAQALTLVLLWQEYRASHPMVRLHLVLRNNSEPFESRTARVSVTGMKGRRRSCRPINAGHYRSLSLIRPQALCGQSTQIFVFCARRIQTI